MNTGRASDMPPIDAPYNIAINRQWYKTHWEDPEFQVLMKDWYWYKYGNPSQWEGVKVEDLDEE
jgi:hypothetical protein